MKQFCFANAVDFKKEETNKMRSTMFLLWIAVLVLRITFAHAKSVSFDCSGRVNLPSLESCLTPQAVIPPWKVIRPEGIAGVDNKGVRRLSIRNIGKGGRITVEMQGRRLISGGAHIKYAFMPTDDFNLLMLGIEITQEISKWPGLHFLCDGTKVKFPSDSKTAKFFDAPISCLEIAGDNRRVRFDFDSPSRVYMQSSRPWQSERFTVRFLVPDSGNCRKGSRYDISFSLFGAGDFEEPDSQAVEVRKGKGWIPLTVKKGIKDGSVLDFSEIRPTKGSAGELGHIVARGENFEFENLPGVAQRFYGVNVCGTACMPPIHKAEQFARDLAKMGYNSVRLHHMEVPLVEGATNDLSRTLLDDDTTERLDAFIAACIKNGLYLSTDLYVSRANAGIPWRNVEVDKDGFISNNEFKWLVYVDEGVYSNYIAFARNFIGHVNPYTGRSLAKEPALGWVSFVNEGNLDHFRQNAFQGYPAWQNAWRKWIEGKKKTEPEIYSHIPCEIPVDVRGGQYGAAFQLFLQDVEIKFAKRVTTFLRNEMGCMALTTDMNNSADNTLGFSYPRAIAYDYVDCHFYVDHPRFLGADWRLPARCDNVNPIKSEGKGMLKIAGTRVFGRPFTVSEYNYCAPSEYRNVGPMIIGTAASLQNWSGVWRFAWTHNSSLISPHDNKTISYFNVAADPLSLAAERAAMCLYMRGDVQALNHCLANHLPLKKIRAPFPEISSTAHIPWCDLGWRMRIGQLVADVVPDGYDVAGVYPQSVNFTVEDIRSRFYNVDDIQKNVIVDGSAGSFSVVSSKTCGGFSESGSIKANFIEVSLDDKKPVAVWVSSLDGATLASSDKILLTHLTDVRSDGARYENESCSTILAWGHGYCMRESYAKVILRCANKRWQIFVLDTDGTRRCELPYVYDESNGELRFDSHVGRDPNAASFMYEIVSSGDCRK